MLITGEMPIWDDEWEARALPAISAHGKDRPVEEMANQRIGDYVPFRQFGLVTGITILYSLIVSIVVVPPMLIVWAAYHEWRAKDNEPIAHTITDHGEITDPSELPETPIVTG